MKFTNENILNTSQCGIEFEFFSDLSEKEVARSISKALGKKVVIPYEISGFNTTEVKSKPTEKPDAKKFILTPDYSGGNKMRELVTGPLPYAEARLIIIKMFKWITENGWTTDKCGIHLNISFIPELHLLGRWNIMDLDKLKFCLTFDENFIYNLFPDRKDNVYADSIKRIFPINQFTFTDNFQGINRSSYSVPNTKYFGVNFLKLEKNYLEFRYIGGTDYNKKTQKVLDCLDNFTIQLFNIIADQNYSESDISKLKKYISKHKKIVEGFSNYDNFIFNFPKIAIMANLQSDKQTLLSYWDIIRKNLYDLIVYGGMKEGTLNYDSDASVIQVMNSELKKATGIRNFEFFNTKLNGIFDDCMFYDCTIENSHLTKCSLIKGCLVNESKITLTPINYSNKLVSCYIDNSKTMINGKLEACIIRHGEVSQMAVLDDKCLIVDKN